MLAIFSEEGSTKVLLRMLADVSKVDGTPDVLEGLVDRLRVRRNFVRLALLLTLDSESGYGG